MVEILPWHSLEISGYLLHIKMWSTPFPSPRDLWVYCGLDVLFLRPKLGYMDLFSKNEEIMSSKGTSFWVIEKQNWTKPLLVVNVVSEFVVCVFLEMECYHTHTVFCFEPVGHWDGPPEATLSSYQTGNPRLLQPATGSLLYHHFILGCWLPLWNSIKTAAWFSSNVTKQARFLKRSGSSFEVLVYTQSLPCDILTIGPQFVFFFKKKMFACA